MAILHDLRQYQTSPMDLIQHYGEDNLVNTVLFSFFHFFSSTSKASTVGYPQLLKG